MIQDLITNNTELCDIFIFSNRAKAIKASIIYFLDMEKNMHFMHLTRKTSVLIRI